MDTLQQLQSELEQEYQTTKNFFELFPDDKADYSPHAKSMKLKALAAHIAEVFGWPGFMLNTTGLDFAKGEYKPAVIHDRKELLDSLNKNYNSTMAVLKKAKESDLLPDWTMSSGEHIHARWSKYGAIRHALNQITHHRAQLGVYYRLLDIPLPGSYGPTADSKNF